MHIQAAQVARHVARLRAAGSRAAGEHYVSAVTRRGRPEIRARLVPAGACDSLPAASPVPLIRHVTVWGPPQTPTPSPCGKPHTAPCRCSSPSPPTLAVPLPHQGCTHADHPASMYRTMPSIPHRLSSAPRRRVLPRPVPASCQAQREQSRRTRRSAHVPIPHSPSASRAVARSPGGERQPGRRSQVGWAVPAARRPGSFARIGGAAQRGSHDQCSAGWHTANRSARMSVTAARHPAPALGYRNVRALQLS